MTQRISMFAIAATLLVAAIPAQSNPQFERGSAYDKRFVVDALQGHLLAINLSKLALENGKSDFTMKSARMILDDHQRAWNELKMVAMKWDVLLPKEEDEDFARMIKPYRNLGGDSFDGAYRDAMLKGHKMAIDLYKKYATNGSGEIQVYTNRWLPGLMRHEGMFKKEIIRDDKMGER